MIAYLALRLVVFIVWLCPFWLLYAISSCVAFVMYHLGVRRAVVMDNLAYFFPDKSEEELKRLAKKVYRNFLDVMVVEMLKFFTLSQKSLHMRFRLSRESYEGVHSAFNNKQDVILVLGHHSNWEWPLSLQGPHLPICFYKPIKNARINHYVKVNRQRFGFVLESSRKPNPHKVMHTDYGQPNLFTLVADRLKVSDKDKKRTVTVEFLGKQSQFLAGPAVYSLRRQAKMFFVQTHRVKRGYYQCEVAECVASPGESEVESLTQQWVSKLEDQIKQYPDEWLWFWSFTRR